MAVRERDELWERAMRQLAYREREIAELSEDYLALEQRCNALLAVIRRQAARDRLECVNRMAKASND